MRIRLLRGVLWFGGLACLFLPVCDDPPLRCDGYVQDVRPDRATLAWIGAAPAVVAVTVLDAAGGVVTEQRAAMARRRQALEVTGLQAGASYRYRLTADGVAAGEGTFRTPPVDDRQPVRFAFCGDSGKMPWWVWLQRSPAGYWPAALDWLPPATAVGAVGARVAAYRPDFFLHLGDVIYPRGLNAHYRAGFFRPFGAVLAEAPCYAVLGNHDVMDADGVQLLGNFRLPQQPGGAGGRCFEFAWGGVRVIGLDLDPSSPAGTVDAAHPAHRFLVEALRRASEPWVVVASHYPARSASRQRNRADLLRDLLPTLAEHQVSLYLCGHDHCYQRFGPTPKQPVPLIVSGGGGKDLYEVVPDPAAAVLVSQHHWCSAEVSGGTLRVRSHGLDGAILDTLDLGLPAGDELARMGVQNPARAARIAALSR